MGDVPQQQAGAVRPGPEYDIFEVPLHVGLAYGAQHDVAVAGLHRARRDIQGGRGDSVGDLAQGQVVFAQQLLGYLYGNLVVPGAHDLRGGDLGVGQQLAADLLGQGLQAALPHVTGDLHGQGGELQFGLADNGLLRLVREMRDGVDPVLDLVHQLGQVVTFHGLDHDAGVGFEGVRLNPLDAVHIVDGILDLEHDPLFHLLGRRPGIGCGDENHLYIHFRQDGALDTERGAQAQYHDDDHQQVGGDRVIGEPGDNAAPL